MIRIESRYLEAVENAARAVDLFEALQKAIELEHATIPPYLLACYSLIEGQNTPIRKALLGIAEEEMLHMAIVCNVLNAIGGKPHIAAESFVPKYPSALPMSIGGGLIVGLKKFSLETLRDTFMKIEEPETPLEFPELAMAEALQFKTIGIFYSALIKKIAELGNPIFTGSPDRQVVVGAGFPEERLFPITGVETATRALRWILEDGEGTSTSPLDVSGELAHYYRFAEISHLRRLVPSTSAPEGYAYAGDRIAFVPEEVCDFPDNPKAADYAPDSFPRGLVDDFNLAYSNVLRDLQIAFDGTPGHIHTASNKMVALRGLAEDALRFIDSETGRNVGVSFEYVS
jgi:rubrerythrin